MKDKHFKTAITISVLFSLFGCGGGSGGGSTVTATGSISTGYFIDAPVQGVNYSCGGQAGTTKSDGAFQYETGKGCTFTIGNVTIGTVTSIPTDSKVTPFELVGTVRTDSQNISAGTIAQLLQTLNNGATGGVITIPSTVGTALAASSFAGTSIIQSSSPISQTQLQSLVNVALGGTQTTLVSTASALSNMNTYLQSSGAIAGTGTTSSGSGTSTAGTSNIVLTQLVVSASDVIANTKKNTGAVALIHEKFNKYIKNYTIPYCLVHML